MTGKSRLSMIRHRSLGDSSHVISTCFLKIKQEASGRPNWVKTDEDFDRYITLYEQREGIRLDPNNINHNQGLRSLSKLLLNSFWGKFGQRMNLSKTQSSPRAIRANGEPHCRIARLQ
jgi:hypothetical protein